MTELPPGWTESTVGAVTVNYDGRRVPVKASERETRKGPYPYFGAQGQIDWIDSHIFDGTYLLIAEDGANLITRSQPIARVVSGKFWVNNHAHVVQTNGVELRYLQHFLNGNPLQGVIRGTAQPKLTKADLNRLPIPLPPLDEQRRIVTILEDHLSRLDAAAEYVSASARKVDVMYRGVLRAAMQGSLVASSAGTHGRFEQLELRTNLYPVGMKRGRPDPVSAAGEIDGWPSHWVRVSLEEATHPVRTISYGILKPGPNTGGGVPYVRVVNMRNDVLSLDDLHRTTLEIAAQYERASLIPGDVLISIRGTYGRVVIVPPALLGGNITQDTARLAFVGPIDSEFAAIYLRSPQAQNYLKRVARGVAVKGVNIADLRAMPFPIPPMAEQQAIIRRVAELSSEVHDTRRTIRAVTTRAQSLRRALLDAAFSGRLTGRSTGMDLVEEMAGV